MAAPLGCVLRCIKGAFILQEPLLLQYVSLRHASKKAGGSSKNKRGRGNPSVRGPKKFEGDYVEKGMMLHKQLGLQYYPGENVGCGRDLTLFALEAGRVTLSLEELSPHPSSPLYPATQAGKVFIKTFYHVVTEPHQPRFKLVSQT